MSHVAGKWTNEDRVLVSRQDTRTSGIVEVPSGLVAVVNGLVRPERTVRVRQGDRLEFRRRGR